jgi:Arc/MetJ-type ribon-helix-helix transcriptional regulator
MEIDLTPDQEALIRAAIEAGRIGTPEDAMKAALALWEERERSIALAEFRATLDDAEASIAAGEGVAITRKSMRELAESVKRRGRARRVSEKQAQR